MPKRNNSKGRYYEQRGGQGLVNTVIPASASVPKSSPSFADRAKSFAKEAALVAAQEAQKMALATAMAATEEAGRVATESIQNAAQGKGSASLEDILKAGAQRVAAKATTVATEQAQAEALRASQTAAQRMGLPGLVPIATQILPVQGLPVSYATQQPLIQPQLLQPQLLQPQLLQPQLLQPQLLQPQPIQVLPELIKEIKPVAQMSSPEIKTAILAQLEKCLPQIQTMNEFSELLVQCLSQEAGELYLPSQSDINELSSGLKTMREQGVDFADPEIVKILLYGTKSAKKLLDRIPGYDSVVDALDKITAGQKISAPELEKLETATAEEMQKVIPLVAQAGGYYYSNRYSRLQSGGARLASDEYHSEDYSDSDSDSDSGSALPSGLSVEWMGKIMAMANEMGLMGELQNLQAVLADGKITEEEFKSLSNRLLGIAQKFTQPKKSM